VIAFRKGKEAVKNCIALFLELGTPVQLAIILMRAGVLTVFCIEVSNRKSLSIKFDLDETSQAFKACIPLLITIAGVPLPYIFV
jgi:hypothetical protein